jgi:ATP-dependent protease Clp, ATPase subunit
MEFLPVEESACYRCRRPRIGEIEPFTASWLFRASGSPRARALRTIVEESLLEVMYDIPDRTEIRKCIITEETIRDGRPPLLLTKTEVDGGVDETNYAEWLATQGATA